MADIFVSYATADRDLVAPVVKLLESRGWSVWWDTRINLGEVWDEIIERELRSARCVVVVWTPNSVRSRWVRAEAGEALERKALVPVSINGAKPPLGFKLIQTMDMSHWASGNERDGAPKFLAAVERVAGTPIVPGTSPPAMHTNAEHVEKVHAFAGSLTAKLLAKRMTLDFEHLLVRLRECLRGWLTKIRPIRASAAQHAARRYASISVSLAIVLSSMVSLYLFSDANWSMWLKTFFDVSEHNIPQQVADRPRVPASELNVISWDGVCDREELTRIQDVKRAVTGIGYTFVMKDGPHLATNSSNFHEQINKPLLAFEEATIYGVDSDTNKVLISLRNMELCGWISSDMLLQTGGLFNRANYRHGPAPVKIKDSPFGTSQPTDTLPLKIILHSPRLPDNGGVPVFESPGGRRLPSSQGLFNVYEVFDIAVAEDTETKEKTHYYLAGWTPEGAGHKKLRGWVREKDLYPWTNRIAVMWEGSSTALGYSSPDLVREGQDPAFKKLPGFSEIGQMHIARRLPLLGQYPPQAQIQGHTAKIDQMIEWYHVVAPGDVCDPSVRDSGALAKCATAEVSDELRAKLEKGVQSLSNMDILLLIENTPVERQYMGHIRNAIEEFVRRRNIYSGRDDRGVRIGAAIYGDYRSKTVQRDNVQFDLAVRLQAPRPAMLDDLLALKPFTIDGRSALRAPFAALINAAERSGWNDLSAFRYIIHIAERGNRELGQSTNQENDPLVERVSINEVIETLKKNRLIYVPIVVGNNAKALDKDVADAQRALPFQASEIIEGAPGYAMELLTAPTNHDLEPRILLALENILSLSAHTRDQAVQFRTCIYTPRDPNCRSFSPSGIILRLVLRDQGLTEEVTNILTQTQMVSAYYFPSRDADGKPNFTFWLALDQVALVTLVELTRTACRTIGNRVSFRNFKELLQEVEGTAGTTSSNSPAEAMEQALGIPALYFGAWMNMSWEKLERKIEDTSSNEELDVKKELCRKSIELSLVNEGMRADPNDFIWSTKEGSWDVPVERKQRFIWSYDSGDGLPFYYVPMELLP
jgi:hypothetical protein